MKKNSAPLDDWPVLRTASVGEAEHALLSVFGARHFEPAKSEKPFYVHANHKALSAISLSYCGYTNPVTIEFGAAPFLRKAFSLGGSGVLNVAGLDLQTSPARAGIAPANIPLTARFGEDYRQLLLRVDESALISKLAALIGASTVRKIEFAPVEADGARLAGLERLVSYLAGELDAAPGALPPTAFGEIEQAVLLAFLWAHPNNYSHLLEAPPRDVAPWQVKRAEEYIEANWNSHLTVEAIAEAVGASARSVFLSFRQARGYSPMQFAKATRLRHAHLKLTAPKPEATVTGIALECGFQNMGHFAINYRRQFGETPSETLRQAKARTSAG